MSFHTYHDGAEEPAWRDPDLSLVDDRRGPVPSVPLALIPSPWREWIAETEQATGAPADYVLQSVLAGVASVCGAGVRVRVTPAWDEPLVLWLAAVGEPSSGKSAALAPMRRLLEAIEQERRLGDEERRAAHAARCRESGEDSPFVPSQIVATGGEDPAARPGLLAALADIVAGNPRGILLWRDGAADWIGEAGEGGAGRMAGWLAGWAADPLTLGALRRPARSLDRFALSLLETVRPERLRAALEAGDGGVAARFLFAWPGPQPYRALAVVERSTDEMVLQRLRALSRLGRGADDPCVLDVDARGRAALDTVLAGLHEDRRAAEGLEAAWLGRSRSLIVRLAGVLELMATVDGRTPRPGAIGAEQVEAAAALWRDYFRPHAAAVFDSAELSDHTRRVRRVARWLLDHRPATVSREDIRRRALSLSATAEETESALRRLQMLGYVQPDVARRGGPGRPTTHWEVNPALVEGPEPSAKLA
ncbi:DUF3987 domain-containing protein [Reyranella sp.]|uniref:DUF3987 domain-containing protein n=1 Tax=Reyranella sp. TaxID=1929291 RepID=UPI003BA9ACBA